MKIEKPHPHAAFIAEAIKDTSRKIMGKQLQSDFLDEVTLCAVVLSNELWEFCFADTVKPDVVSSLTDDELFAIAEAHVKGDEDINYSIIKAVANAAAAKQNADSSKPKPLIARSNLPQNFIDHDLITPEEIAALYKNTKV